MSNEVAPNEVQKPVNSLEAAISERKKTLDEKITADLRAKIAVLKKRKMEQAVLLENLKREYSEGHEVAKELATEREGLQEIFDKNKTTLESDNIKSKAEMIQSPAYSEVDTVVDFRAKENNLRNKVTSIKNARKDLQTGMPDFAFRKKNAELSEAELMLPSENEEEEGDSDNEGKLVSAHNPSSISEDQPLDFRGGKRKGERESPRDISFRKLESEISEIDQEIEGLEEQLPERVERREKLDECEKKMKGEFVPFSFVLNDLSTYSLKSACMTEKYTGYTQSIIDAYGEDIFKEALKRCIAEKAEVFIKEIEKKNGGYPADSTTKERILEALRTKVDFDLANRERVAFINEHPEIMKLQEEMDRTIYEAGHVADREFKLIEELEGKNPEWLSRNVRIIVDPRNPRNGGAGLVVRYAYDLSEDQPEALKIKQQITSGKAETSQLETKLGVMRKKFPRWFGKENATNDIHEIEDKINVLKKETDRFEENYRQEKRKEKSDYDENIMELTRIVQLASSLVSKMEYKVRTISEFLAEAKKYWLEAKETKPSPDAVALVDKRRELMDKEAELKRQFERLVN